MWKWDALFLGTGTKYKATDDYVPTLLELPLMLTNITKRPPSRSVRQTRNLIAKLIYVYVDLK